MSKEATEAFPFSVIARAHTDFPEKFGIPRQGTFLRELTAEIVFETSYRNPDALRGLEEFSHLWLLWLFSESRREGWSATVRPPKLGGNERRGVFATRSPYRPNPIGLSCVRLEEIRREDKRGCVLVVSGCDLMDGTPILDIKPYLPYCDAFPDAAGGFGQEHREDRLRVECEEATLLPLPADKRAALLRLLETDPRPSYHDDPKRIYGFTFAGCRVKFCVCDGTLRVTEIMPLP